MNKLPVWVRVVISVAIAVAIGYFGTVIPGKALQRLGLLNPDGDPRVLTALCYGMFLVIWALTFLWCRVVKADRPILREMGPANPGNRIGNVMLGAALGFGMNVLCVLGARVTGVLSFTFVGFEPLWLLLILVCMGIQSSAEEIVCRGLMLSRVIRDTGKPWIAAVLNSLAFAAMHLANQGMGVLPFVNMLLFGLFMSLLVCRLHSLWAACAAHTAWNFTQTILFGLPNSGNDAIYAVLKVPQSTLKNGFFMDADFGLEGSPACTLMFIIALGALCMAGRKKGVKAA